VFVHPVLYGYVEQEVAGSTRKLKIQSEFPPAISAGRDFSFRPVSVKIQLPVRPIASNQ
jgi:hypothetical protein